MDYPKLRRDVNAFPIAVDGKAMICFQDSQRLSEGILIPQALFARIVSLFDGEHSFRDIQCEAMRRYGELVYTDQIKGVAEKFDTALLLESPRFHETLAKLVENFEKGTCRPAFFSGTGYGKTASELKDQLAAYFGGPGGPGGPTRRWQRQRRRICTLFLALPMRLQRAVSVSLSKTSKRHLGS
jgi:hypothetical protein